MTLDPDTLPEQLEHLGLPRSLTIPEAAVHPAVRAAVQKLVDEANQLVSRAEGIREFRIMNRDLTEADGYLTPSQKLRRAKILQDFSSYVDEMYGKVSDSTSDSLARLQEYAAEQSEKFAELREQAAERLHEYADHQAERLAELREQAAEKFEELREQTAEMMQKPQEEEAEEVKKAEKSSAEAPAEKAEAKKAEKKPESDNA